MPKKVVSMYNLFSLEIFLLLLTPLFPQPTIKRKEGKIKRRQAVCGTIHAKTKKKKKEKEKKKKSLIKIK